MACDTINLTIFEGGEKPSPMGCAEGRLDEWCADNLKNFADTFGKENIEAAHLHRDEETPHIHVTLVPIVKGERKRRK